MGILFWREKKDFSLVARSILLAFCFNLNIFTNKIQICCYFCRSSKLGAVILDIPVEGFDFSCKLVKKSPKSYSTFYKVTYIQSFSSQLHGINTDYLFKVTKVTPKQCLSATLIGEWF